MRIRLVDRANPDEVMAECLAAGPVRMIERSRTTLDEVFVSLVAGRNDPAGRTSEVPADA